jgi:hypothetical protein
VQAGKISERTIATAAPRFDYDPFRELQERIFKTAVEKGLSQKLVEAFVNTPDAFNMLRTGIKYYAFTAFGQREPSFNGFVTRTGSNKPHEEYLRDAGMGTMPATPSGTPVPFVQSGFDGGVKIENKRYAQGVEFTGDDLRFDNLGKMRQIAPELGISAANTLEAAVYAIITNTNNFTRNSTTGDNDVGANTAASTWNALSLELAYATIATSKDRRSGSYLGLMPDTIICGPRMRYPVLQLVMADSIVRASANNTAEVRGTGTSPIYRGLIKNIIVTPWFATTTSGYQWALCDSTRQSVVLQEVEPLDILQESADASSEAWLIRNSLRYVASMYFGVGIVDDRPWYYSSSTTATTIS